MNQSLVSKFSAIAMQIIFLISMAGVASAAVTITLDAPADGYYITSLVPATDFNYTPVNDTSAIQNCSLWSNETGSWASTQANTSAVLFNTTNTISYGFGNVSGYYLWSIECYEGGLSYFASENRTVILDNVPPSTTASAVDDSGSAYTFGTWAAVLYVNVSLSATDATSGVDTILYCLDTANTCVPNTTYTGVVQVSTEGISYIRYKANDSAGNDEAVQSSQINIDTTAPSTTASAVDDTGASYTFGTWTSSSYVNITLTSTDTGSGVDTLLYCIDTLGTCAPNTTYTGTIQFSTEGKHYIRYRANDTVGNLETVAGQQIDIDLTAPNTTASAVDDSGSAYTFGTWTNSTYITVNLTATDGDLSTTSGVSGTYYCIDTADTCTPNISYTAPFNITSEGVSYVRFFSNDTVGNTETTNSQSVKIDRTAPTTTDNAPVGWQNAAFTVTLTPTDTGSGVNATIYSLDGGAWTAGTSIAISTSGNHTINYRSNDSVGNLEAIKTTYAALDLVYPSVTSIITPVSGANVSANLLINATAIDSYSGITSVAVVLLNSSGGVVGSSSLTLASGSSTLGNWTGQMDVSTLPTGVYTLLFNATTDAAGNTNTSILMNRTINIDNTPPVITLISPLDRSYTNESSVYFRFNVTDITGPGGSGVDYCQAYDNIAGSWAVDATETSIYENTTTQISSALFPSQEAGYIWNIKCVDRAGNEAWFGSNYTIYHDNASPRVSYSVNETALTAGETVAITVNVSDLNISRINVTINHQASRSSWQLYYNDSVNVASKVLTLAFTPNYSGPYAIDIVASDRIPQITHTSNNSFFTVYNGQPSWENNSGAVDLVNENFAQLNSYYDLPIPYYAGEPGEREFRTNYTNLQTMPLYFNKPLFEGPDEMQNLAYNYSFTIDTSDLAANSVVSINFTVPGALPAFVKNETIATPEGNVTTTLVMPAMSDSTGSEPVFLSRYSAYVNGVLYNTNESSNVTGSIGLDANGRPLGWFVLNLTGLSNASNYTVSIPMAVAPTIRIDSQAISGFDPVNPPTLGENITTTYFVNMTAINEYYIADNVSVLFIFPINATMNGVTKNISSNVSIQLWNGSAYVTAPTTTSTSCVTMNDSLFSQNITVCLTEYRVQLSNTSDLTSWENGTTKKLKASAVLSFPTLNESTPSGSAGSNEYKASVTMGTDAGLYIPTDKLPGITNASNVKVYVNGRELSSTNYVVGSIKINGTALNSGANDVKVTYNVASSSSSSGIGTGGSGSTTPSQSVMYTLIPEGETREFDFTNEELPVDEVVITAGETIENAKITVVSLGSEKPAVVQTAPPAKVYKYIQLDTSNINEKITQAKVKFKVEKTWFEQNGYDPSTTTLNRYHNEQWEEYSATQVSEDDNYYYFEAEVPGFSYFAITADVITVIQPPQEEQQQETGTEQPATGQQEITPSLMNYDTALMIFIAVIFILAAAYFLKKK